MLTPLQMRNHSGDATLSPEASRIDGEVSPMKPDGLRLPFKMTRLVLQELELQIASGPLSSSELEEMDALSLELMRLPIGK